MPSSGFGDYMRGTGGSLALSVYYDSLVVEQQREVLLYDVPGFLSALGGTLGLYLGFSILSTLLYLVEKGRRWNMPCCKNEK